MKKRRYKPSKKEEEEDLPRYPIYQMEDNTKIENLNGYGIGKKEKDFREAVLYSNGNRPEEANQLNGLT